LLGTFVFFVTMLYALVVSKFMPYTGNYVLDWIRDDMYYSPLVICSIPATVIAVYLNWLGLKFFRHN